MVGKVNTSPNDARKGYDGLDQAKALFSGGFSQLLTTAVMGLERCEERFSQLAESQDAIKSYVESAGIGEGK
jgi:hypothetical protein